jgi:fluoroacetyl-CoA thioesterase
MGDALKPGFTFEMTYTVPRNKTVPHLYPEFPEAQEMPNVFATGFLVGLFEFACIQAINPCLDWPREQTVGIQINIEHTAATPPGMTITIKGTLDRIEGKKLFFSLVAHDEVEQISKGTHQRFIINAEKFNARLDKKSSRVSVSK